MIDKYVNEIWGWVRRGLLFFDRGFLGDKTKLM